MTLQRVESLKILARVLLMAALPALGGGPAAKAAKAPAPSKLVIVATIPPIHSLAAQVMAGVGHPRLLLAKGSSPHDYALKPSDARALSRAALVIWVGPGLESFLARPLKTLARNAEKLALLGVPGLHLRRARTGGVWPLLEGEKGHGIGHVIGHGAGQVEGQTKGLNIDPHIWLDPGNAITMVGAIARALGRADPANKARYAANARRAVVTLTALDRRLARRLAPIRRVPYIVFHDAYGYFEGRYGLSAVAAVAVNAARRPGIRRIRAIRARLKHAGAACVFTEPQFSPALAATLTEGSGAGIGILDPIGMDITPGPELYPALLTGLGQALVSCLSPGKGRTRPR